MLKQGRKLPILLRCLEQQKLSPLIQLSRSASQRSSWNYEEEKRTFKLEAPHYYNFARDVIDMWAEKEKTGARGDNPALWWMNETGQELKWGFQEISQKSKLVANVLTGACKLKANDVVIVILPRIPEWWIINIAAIRAGIILSPGTVMLRSKDIKHRLNASQAKCIIALDNCADEVDMVSDDCPHLQTKVLLGNQKRPGWLNYDDLLAKSTDSFQTVQSKSSDPMTVFFTSGTTGAPKMTEHTHSSYGLGHLITARYFLELTPYDVLWNLSDTGWAKCAWSSLFAPWIAGACVFAQDSAKFDPQLTLQMLASRPISHFCAPPTAIRFLVREDLSKYKSSSLLRCFSAGEPVNPELIEEWEVGTGVHLLEGYGQTETTFLCGTYTCIEQKPGSMGKAAPGYDLRIVNDDGVEVPHGTEGNIGIRCKPHRPVGLFSRYVDAEDTMWRAHAGDFYLTGDRAIMDDEDYVWFVGRADDVILSAGYRIGPFEVESALIEHPAVLESAVVSSPDPVRGEVVKAFVTLTAEYKNVDLDQLAKDLQDHTKHVTAPYKYPRKIEFVETLPKTVSGKIRRVELRHKEWEKHTEGSSPA